MLFQEKIDPMCTYCAKGKHLADGQIACPKRGITAPDASCRAFHYDPLKRVPPRPAAPKAPNFSPDDLDAFDL